MRRFATLAFLLFGLVLGPDQLLCGQDSEAQIKQADTSKKATKSTPTDPALLAKFESGLTNTKFVGQFTVDGLDDKPPRTEEYTIVGVKKQTKGDWWEIKARIKYGDHDLTVPMAVEVKWAGKTPVITVDRLFIPGLGTFDARVLLRKDKYSGTWTHDNVGGHLFGKIVKLPKADESDAEEKADSNQDK